METEDHTIALFLKFGQEEHILDMFENGTIYMNSIQYFREYEDGGLRGDSFEGISRLTNLPSGTFELKNLNYKGNYEAIQIREAYDEVVGNIYSLYCISSHGFTRPEDVKIDERNKEFGTHCLMVKDNIEFLKLLEKTLHECQLKFRHGFVKYYDKKQTNHNITLFQKPNEYEFQKEFRIYVERESIEPLKIQIGSMKNIAEICNTHDIIDGLSLKSTASDGADYKSL